MPGMGGLEALRRIRARYPQARILALSAHDDPMHARRALQEGALGFLSKRSAPEALLEAVSAVAAGRRYLDPGIAQKLALAEFEGGTKSPIERLSEREFEVFVRLAGGAGAAHRPGFESFHIDDRHSSLQHQAEAAGGEPVRTDLDRHSTWADRDLTAEPSHSPQRTRTPAQMARGWPGETAFSLVQSAGSARIANRRD